MNMLIRRRRVGPPLAFTTIMFASVWSNCSLADCKYADVRQAVGPGEAGIKVALLAAGSSSNEFLSATANALNDLRHTDGGIIQSVTLEYLDEGSSVVQKFSAAQKKFNAFAVLDSEFMSAESPKYNDLLDYYKNHVFKQRTVMVIDRFLSARESSAFVQVTAGRGAKNAALLVEVAAAVIAHPDLAKSKAFLHHFALVTSFATLSEGDPDRPGADEITKSRDELFIQCMRQSAE